MRPDTSTGQNPFDAPVRRLESGAKIRPAELDALAAEAAAAQGRGDLRASEVLWTLAIRHRHKPAFLPLAQGLLHNKDEWSAYVIGAVAISRGQRTAQMRALVQQAMEALRAKFPAVTAVAADPAAGIKAQSLMLKTSEGDMNATGVVAAALKLFEGGRYAAAEAACAAVGAALPAFADAWIVQAVSQKAQRKYPQAIDANLRAIWLGPVNYVPLSNLASLLLEMQRMPEARRFAELALVVDDKWASAWINLSGALIEEPGRAEAAARAALGHQPENSAAHLNLGNALKQQGRLDEAIACFREVARLKPDDALAYQNMLVTIQYSDAYTPDKVAAEHFEFAGRFEAKLRPAAPVFANARDPERQLRVGFVSGDFRDHACSYFVEPLWAHLDKTRFAIHGYSTKIAEDGVTQRLKSHAALWRPVASLSDADTAELVKRDGVDILVDIAGHTAGNRLLAFAREPAPVQVTWLGNPNTTGLKSIGWRLTDGLCDPPGAERLYSERLYRLPDVFCCYRPMIRRPELRHDPAYAPQPTPALRNGYVTFGSCNNVAKLSASALRLWARILDAVPDSKLLIEAKDVDHPQLRASFVAKAEAAGIALERLVLVGRDLSKQYLRYHEIDIALDPFPANGGTTTCDVLWMGVPMVTMPGDAFFARMGYGLATAGGQGDLAARDEAQYLEFATALAGDVAALNKRRLGQRAAVEASPLMDEKRYAAAVGAAFRDMWRDWLGRA